MTEIIVETPEEIIEHLARLRDGFPDEMKDALWQTLADVLTVSKRLCPFETGALRGSGHVPEPHVAEGMILADIGYSQNYAWWVHELIGNYHKPPTQAKYLEVPLMAALPRLTEDVIRRTEHLILEG